MVQAARAEELLLKLTDNQTLVTLNQLQALEEVPMLLALDPVVAEPEIKCPLLQVKSMPGLKFTVNLLKKTNGLQSKSLILFFTMKNKSRQCKERQKDVA